MLVIKPLILVLGPAVELVIGTVIVQELFAAIVPPDKLTLLVPVVAVSVPLQVLVAALEMLMPVGRVSLKPTPFKAIELLFVSVKVRLEVPPAPIGLGENDLVIEGGRGVPQPVKVTPSK